MGDWAANFDCWDADKHPLKADRFCPVCGANKPLENHETWCPNEPDRAVKDDRDFWYGLGAQAADKTAMQYLVNTDSEDCSCGGCQDAIVGYVPTWIPGTDLPKAACQCPTCTYARANGVADEDWIRRNACISTTPAALAYHAPEKLDEDWGLRDECLLGPGSAPNRASTLPTDAAGRKAHPVASGVLDYFPDALVAIAHVSWKGNEQHNPGQPLHWDRSKSQDEADTMLRHFLQRGSLDVDGQPHTAKMAWRALALLQKEIEAGRA